MESFHLHRSTALSLSRGFSLVELLVVLGIIGVVMSIVLTSQSSFNKTLILQNTAYDIALTLRSAQTFGMSSRVRGNTSNAGYGVHFETAYKESFVLFADIYPPKGRPSWSLCHTPPANDPTGPNAQPGNCLYDLTAGERVQTYTLGNGITVADFCAYTGDGSPSCASRGRISSLDIVFTRPNPNAFIRSGNSAYASACITVTSPQGGARYVSVAASGQIIANAAPCL